MKRRACPECGAETIPDVAVTPGLDDLVQYCPNGHGGITQEGLLLREVAVGGTTITSEVGKGGQVICQYGGGHDLVGTLVQCIVQIENEPKSQEKILDIQNENLRRWNLKRAKRRFRRLLNERNDDLPAIEDPKLRRRAEELSSERSQGREQMGRASWTTDDVQRWGTMGFLQELKEYESRKEGEPILLFSEEIPGPLGKAFQQARECYRWGLFVATVGMCRVVLETAVRLAAERKREPSWPQQIDKNFKDRLSCVPHHLLSPTDRKRAEKIWDDCNTALHEAEASFGDDDAWQTLTDTAAIVATLANRDGLGEH